MTSLSAWDNGKKTSWGIKAGLNYSGVTGLNGIQDVDLRDNTGFNVGLAFKAKLPLFFAIQREPVPGCPIPVSMGHSITETFTSPLIYSGDPISTDSEYMRRYPLS